MSRIKLLSKEVINKIAAGEVIERPLSVVKELVENAIDANSSSIKVQIKRGGRNLISVTDNGCGIKKEDLFLAVQRHATSKLDDLTDINHLGFRGEALASIENVSNLSIVTKESIEGSKLENGSIYPVICEKGTTIEVRNLFYSTPNKLRFLKKENIENIAIIDLLEGYSLYYNKVDFTLLIDDRVVLAFPSTEDRLARIENILGKKFISYSLP